MISFQPRDIGSEQEWRQRVFPMMGKRMPLVDVEGQPGYSIFIYVLFFILLIVIIAYLSHRTRRSNDKAVKPTGVHDNLITGIVSIDKLTVEKLKSVVEANLGIADFPGRADG